MAATAGDWSRGRWDKQKFCTCRRSHVSSAWLARNSVSASYADALSKRHKLASPDRAAVGIEDRERSGQLAQLEYRAEQLALDVGRAAATVRTVAANLLDAEKADQSVVVLSPLKSVGCRRSELAVYRQPRRRSIKSLLEVTDGRGRRWSGYAVSRSTREAVVVQDRLCGSNVYTARR
jgi:hypothetical protein